MDWFSWLSKTGLEPSLVYEYGLSFSHNELEEEDIVYLDHEFLQSMGISIAKHRLEILKLAGKTKGSQTSGWGPVVRRLMSAIKRTKRSLSKYMKAMVEREASALVVVNRRNKWKGGAMLKRKKRVGMGAEGRLLLTNGTHLPPITMVIKYQKKEKREKGSWLDGAEEMKWDAMFQDLKPT
ncbi:hypothetical protein J1N35_031547 [Gossypium stocksii]|uniref:SAM domain-containing protein n=1 Tax=Gossypium stocksii TaxID=47602 RepID=A0A9D3V241_9ROSI|nr:hypothetical protein J1N35_031547 [Gossypium stocksii]